MEIEPIPLALDVAGAAAVFGGAAALLWSAWRHRGRSQYFRAVLIAHRVVPFPLTRLIATAWPVAEVLIGSSVIVAGTVLVWGGPRTPFEALSAVVAVTYLCLACYLLTALARSGGAPCGCFADDRPITWGTIGRALLVAVVAGQWLVSG